MSTFGSRVRERRLALKISQEHLGSLVGLTQTAIAEIESGRTRKSANILAFARALQVRADWLEKEAGGMADEGREFRPEPAVTRHGDFLFEIGGLEFAKLAVFDIRYAAGAGSTNYDEKPIGYHMIAMSELRTFTDAPVPMIYGFQVIGDSMEKTILDRSWCFADMRINNLRNPGIYCFDNEGEGLLKRAQQNLEDKTVTLISDNPLYPPQVIKKPERLRVIGRVFMSIHRH